MYPTARRAAILAIGKPVALEASAELRDTRGFISMTTISPVARLSANWTLAPPVETPTARMTVRAASRSVCSSGSDRVITGATVAESPVCTPMGSMFSIEHTTTALSAPSRITSSSISAQPRTERSTSTWPIGLASSARARRSSSSAGVRAAPPPSPPSVKPGRRITGRPSSAAAARPAAMSLTTRLAGTARPAAAIVPPEGLAVLGPPDRLGVGADQLHPVPVEDRLRRELHREVQGGLPAERRQQGVRALEGDDRLDGLEVERLDVGAVGHRGVGHDRRGVRVDEHDPVALGAQRPAGLGARVVELARLPDHDRAAAEDQHGADVRPARH